MRYGLLIDYEYCSGCHSCEVACKEEHGFPVGKYGIRVYSDGPWEINNKQMNWNKVPVPTDLCDLCADRVSKGKKPTCVHHCLADVMRFGPLDELVIELDAKGKQVLFVPREDQPFWQEDIDRTSVIELVRDAESIDVSKPAAEALDDVEINRSFKLALQREENRLDDSSDLTSLDEKLKRTE